MLNPGTDGAAAFDFTSERRDEMFSRVGQVIAGASATHKDKAAGQGSLFGDEEMLPGPTRLAVTDFRVGDSADDVHFGAYIFVVIPSLNEVRKFISAEQYQHVYGDTQQ